MTFKRAAIGFIVLSLLFSVDGYSQRSKRFQKYELGGILAASHYLGELGGKGQFGKKFLGDLPLTETQPAIGAFFIYRIKPYLAFRTNIIFGQISGNDKNSPPESGRYQRNLHFRSHIIELSEQVDVNLISYKTLTGRYIAFRNRKNYNWTIYAFGGVAGFHFNPKAKYQGTWYALQPLGTEGEDILSNRKKYSLFQVAVPMGLGIYFSSRYPVKVGFEIGYRKTFTDYLDDVSTTFVDPALLKQAYGPVAAALSNRTAEISTEQYDLDLSAPGQIRGDPKHKDAYIFTALKVSYGFKNSRRRYRYRPKF